MNVMYIYIYNFKWDTEGPCLDTFYEIESLYQSEEEFLLSQSIELGGQEEYERLIAIDIRARLNLKTSKVVKCEMPITREHWEHFLKWEWKHNPKSRWLE